MELAICYGLVQLVIWTSKPLQHLLFWIAFTWILATTLVYRPDANTLGLRLSGLRSLLWITAGGLLFAGLLVGIGFELHTLHPLHGAGSLRLHMAGQCCFRQRIFRILCSRWQLSFGESSRVLSSCAIATFTHSGLSMASWASAWRFQCRMRSLTT